MSQYTNVPDYHLLGDSLPRRAMRQSAPQPAAVRSLMIFLMTSPLLGYGFPWGFLGVGGSPPSMAPTGTLAGEKNRRRLGVVYWFCVE